MESQQYRNKIINFLKRKCDFIPKSEIIRKRDKHGIALKMHRLPKITKPLFYIPNLNIFLFNLVKYMDRLSLTALGELGQTWLVSFGAGKEGGGAAVIWEGRYVN